jgi:hypothetical protein
MKRGCLIALALLSLNTGCIFGRSDGRPGIFTRLHNRIHGTDVGAPCMSCGMAPAPMPIAPPMAMGGCENCGGVETMSYPEYSSGEYSGEYMPGEIIHEGGTYMGTTQGHIVEQPMAPGA